MSKTPLGTQAARRNGESRGALLTREESAGKQRRTYGTANDLHSSTVGSSVCDVW